MLQRSSNRYGCFSLPLLLPFGAVLLLIMATSAIAAGEQIEPTSFWLVWPLALFFFCVAMGMLSILGGVGGALLYLALVPCFFPFHIDFVRTAALLAALVGAMVTSPGLLRRNLANLRLALPAAIVATCGAICGSLLGLALPTHLLQLGLGGTMIAMAFFSAITTRMEWPGVAIQDRIGAALGMSGTCYDDFAREHREWTTHRTASGLLLFFPVGIATGMFGLETSWASISVYNLIMGVPLRVAIGTGKFLGSLSYPAAAWMYMNQGCLIPLMAVPSICGLVLGSFLGVTVSGFFANRLRIFRFIAVAALLLGGMGIILQGFGL